MSRHENTLLHETIYAEFGTEHLNLNGELWTEAEVGNSKKIWRIW